MKVYGYCRISTGKQSIDRQITNILRSEPAAEIVKEVYTGRTTARPQWQKLKRKALTAAAGGESVTIIFDEVSRMSRNAAEGIKEYKELYSAGVDLVFLKDHSCDTAAFKQAAAAALTIPTDGASGEIGDFLKALEAAINKLIESLASSSIKAAFERSQSEVDYLRQRTKEGIQASPKKSGRPAGKASKPSKIGREIITEISKHHKDLHGGQGLNDNEIIELIKGRHGGKGCSRNTYYLYKKALEDLKKE